MIRVAIGVALVCTIGAEAFQAPGTTPGALPRLTFEQLPAPIRRGLEEAYREAAEHPRDAARVGRLAMLLHAHEQIGSAEICYAIAHALESNAFSWAYLIGVTRAEAGDLAGAAGSLRRALIIDPDYLPARDRLADTLVRAGEVDAGLDEYLRLARDFPEFAAAHYGLGRLSSLRGDGTAAIGHYRRAVELAPQFGAAHYALALAYRDAGMRGAATTHLADYRRWGTRRPAPPDPVLDRVRALKGTARDLLAEGARLGQAGRLEESIALHVRALERDPAAAQAHVNLISLYGRLGRAAKAEHHYRAALTLGSNLADAHYNFGVLLAATHRASEAAGVFRLALEVHPFHAQAHNNLATLLAGQGQLDDAVSHYTQAIASDPGHRAARFNLGRTLMALARPDEAAAQFQRLIQRDDDDRPRFTFALATALFAAGDTAKAIESAERALREAKGRGQTDLSATIDAALHKMKGRR